MCSRGTNRPQSSSCGKTIAGMNCTAWNSVRANALTNRPSAIPSRAFATASTTTRQLAPGDVQAEHAEGDRRRSAPPARRRPRANAIAVAEQQVELRERHRHQPLERARRALAQHRDRGDEEHVMNGKMPEQRAADALERRRLPVEARSAAAPSSSARHDEQQRDRARVAAQLRAAPARRWRRRCAGSRRGLGARSGAGTPSPRSFSPVLLAQLLRAWSTRGCGPRA